KQRFHHHGCAAMPKIIHLTACFSALLLSACSPSMQPSPMPPTSNQQAIGIAKDVGVKQCEPLSAQDSLDRMQQGLHKNQIKTLTTYCADDGMMRVQMCGAPQGKLGLYKIKQAQLAKAQSLGFQQVQARQYQQIKCS